MRSFLWLSSTFAFRVSDAAWKWIHGLGGPSLILLGIADNTPFVSAPPGSVDVFVIVLATHNHLWWAYYGLMATLGEVLGGYLTYRLAQKEGQQTLERKVTRSTARKIYATFEKRGTTTILAGALLPPPFPFTSVLMAAGIMQYPQKKLLAELTAGRGIRFMTLAYLSRTYGQTIIALSSRYYRPLMWASLAIAIATAIGAAVYFLWYRPKAQREFQQSQQRQVK